MLEKSVDEIHESLKKEDVTPEDLRKVAREVARRDAKGHREGRNGQQGAPRGGGEIAARHARQNGSGLVTKFARQCASRPKPDASRNGDESSRRAPIRRGKLGRERGCRERAGAGRNREGAWRGSCTRAAVAPGAAAVRRAAAAHACSVVVRGRRSDVPSARGRPRRGPEDQPSPRSGKPQAAKSSGSAC